MVFKITHFFEDENLDVKHAEKVMQLTMLAIFSHSRKADLIRLNSSFKAFYKYVSKSVNVPK